MRRAGILASAARSRKHMPSDRKRGRSASSGEGRRFWLMKSEPYKFSIDDLAAMPSSPWDGVRNYEARNNMDAMKVGDRVLFYHSMAKDTGIVGLAEVSKGAYEDHTAFDKAGDYYDPKATKEKNPWRMVDVKFIEKFPRVVSLAEIKGEKQLQHMCLVSRGRLSVQPVTVSEYEHIVTMARGGEGATTPGEQPLAAANGKKAKK